MDLDTQIKLKKNQNNIRFLREQSYWYKYLNRNKIYFKEFQESLKKTYKMTSEDKIKKIADKLNDVRKIMDIFS